MFAWRWRAWLAGVLWSLASGFAAVAATELERIVVSGTRLREQAVIDVPGSVTVLTKQMLTDSARQHFEEVLGQIPNLSWAAGSSRPRFFQLRGIGEREQYEGAPNPSVGFLIDDVDFSGIGMAATLFDVERIEVLRGPQGTQLGANALGGIITVRSAEPEDTATARVVADTGNYDTRALGVSATAPVRSLDSAWRLSAQTYRSDGFRTNAFLNRDDTNGRDELTARGKWRWQTASQRLDLTFMHIDLDNGYDAFAIDNSRTTLSDRPGEDSQRATAAAARWTNRLSSGSTFTAIATTLDAHSVHAFDGDWGNARSWAPFTYDFFYRANRERRTRTAELRLASPDERVFAWLIGAHALRLSEDIDEISVGTLIDPDPIFGYVFELNDHRISHYIATNLAVFTQLDGKLSDDWVWSAGVRAETRDANYADAGQWSGDPNRHTDANARDDMLGGNFSLTYGIHENARAYATIARGYRAGGFNFGLARQRQPDFAPEFLWNYELGVKTMALDQRWVADATVFYMRRQDMQVRSGTQLVSGDPNSFVFFTSNAAEGKNYGFEGNARLRVTQTLELGASLALLKSSVTGLLDGDGNPLPKREQAHAPSYQAQLNVTWRARGWMARADVAAVDAFFFDTDHNQRSRAYELVHLKAGYEAESWRVYLWGRNVFDEVYATRGFFFGNEPPDFDDKLYLQNGDPRHVGLSIEVVMR